MVPTHLPGAEGRTRTGTVFLPVDFEFFSPLRTLWNSVELIRI